MRLAIEFLGRERERRDGFDPDRPRLDEGSGAMRLGWSDFDAVHDILRRWNARLRPPMAPEGGWPAAAAAALKARRARAPRPGERGAEAPVYARLPRDWVSETT
ncbi:hypothetical protein EOM89_13040 [Candidatus Falkowbacteria bacterium]|nr:hypothetical protein [Candidatus Falkowbacteria bacterium]